MIFSICFLDYLEELCGENMVVNLNETSKFIIQLSKNEDDLTSTGRHGSCHGLLHFRWSGYQELWVTVRVRNASFVKDPAADQQQQQQYGGCNAVHALQVNNYQRIDRRNPAYILSKVVGHNFSKGSADI